MRSWTLSINLFKVENSTYLWSAGYRNATCNGMVCGLVGKENDNSSNFKNVHHMGSLKSYMCVRFNVIDLGE